jgi:hypothetical protein
MTGVVLADGIRKFNHLDLDKDTKEILKVFLNDDDLLKYLTVAPLSSSDNVLTRPSY